MSTADPQHSARALLQAQRRAEALFEDVVSRGLIVPDKLESQLSEEIHALAQAHHGVRRHWHKRIARAGPNSVLTYHAQPPDRRLMDDDVVYLDFGPVFDAWEADFGRTYVLGADPDKCRLVRDIEAAFFQGKALFEARADLTCGELYDHVDSLAQANGWEFGNATAGHLVGAFPHEAAGNGPRPLSIRRGNDLSLREPDANGMTRHWILEIHFIDRTRQFGGFFEQLLTVPDDVG